MIEPSEKAVVGIASPTSPMIRAAMYVYTTPDGFAWVEPSYLDPYNTSPAFHRRRGALVVRHDGFSVRDEDGVLCLISPADDVDWPDITKAFEAADRAIRDAGRDPADEREWVRDILGGQLD